MKLGIDRKKEACYSNLQMKCKLKCKPKREAE